MFSYIEGPLVEKSMNELVIEANGVGYSIYCSNSTISNAPAIGEPMRCYTYLAVREDAMELYGFGNRQEKEMFMRLKTVSGIGPKTALAILGSMALKELSLAIITEDINMLTRAPGVGKKTAQRIALELKEQIDKLDFTEGLSLSDVEIISESGGALNDANMALQALGYTTIEASRALNMVKDQSKETDELIRLALRAMAGR